MGDGGFGGGSGGGVLANWCGSSSRDVARRVELVLGSSNGVRGFRGVVVGRDW